MANDTDIKIVGSYQASNAPLNTPRMRGIKQAIEEIKAGDPNTTLTERALRRMVNTGVIPTVKIGRKSLINMAVLETYLTNGVTVSISTPPAVCGIHRIAE